MLFMSTVKYTFILTQLGDRATFEQQCVRSSFDFQQNRDRIPVDFTVANKRLSNQHNYKDPDIRTFSEQEIKDVLELRRKTVTREKHRHLVYKIPQTIIIAVPINRGCFDPVSFRNLGIDISRDFKDGQTARSNTKMSPQCLVSYAAVLSVVTQRSSPLTTLRTAA